MLAIIRLVFLTGLVGWLMWNAPVVVLPLVAVAFFYLGRTTAGKLCPRCEYYQLWQTRIDKELEKTKREG